MTDIDEIDIASLEDEADQIRRLVLEMARQPNGTHLGGCLSAAEILAVLFNKILRLDPTRPHWPERDHFVLSKGHIAAAYYAALARRGFLEEAELTGYALNGGRLGGHPSHTLPGVEFSTGSLGHGLQLGIGLALAARHFDKASRTFVLMGDGELQEGSVAEGADVGARCALGTLTAIIDRNRLQINGVAGGWVDEDALARRWGSCGWEVAECDGHDVSALVHLLGQQRAAHGKPLLVIARTTKAKGIPFMEGNRLSHSVCLSETHYQRAAAGLRLSRSGRG